MKRSCLLLLALTVLICAILPVPARATDTVYELKDLQLKISIPDSYTVITRDTPADDPIFQEIGLSKPLVISRFREANTYLDTLPINGIDGISITAFPFGVTDFHLLDSNTLEKLLTEIILTFEECGFTVTEQSILHHTQTKFIRLLSYDTTNDIYSVDYLTVYNGTMLILSCRPPEGPVSSQFDAEAEAIVKSIVFDPSVIVYPAEPEAVLRTDPYPFTAPDTGTSFTVPADWQMTSTTPSAEGAYLIEYLPDPSKMVLYLYDDSEEILPVFDDQTLSREEVQNDHISRAWIAESMQMDPENVSTVYYNGIEYFRLDYPPSTNGEPDLIQFLHYRNGCLHVFGYFGTDRDPTFSDFEALLNSVAFPPVTPSGETAPSTGISPLLLIAVFAAGAVLSAAVCILLFRRRTKDTDDIAPHRSARTYCFHCGNPLPPGSAYCNFCGRRADSNYH